MAILAFATGMIVMNAPPRTPPAKQQALKFAAELDKAISFVVLTGAPVRLGVRQGEYQFEVYKEEGWESLPSFLFSGSGVVLPSVPAAGTVISVFSEDVFLKNRVGLNSDLGEERVDDNDWDYHAIDPFGAAPLPEINFQTSGSSWRVVISEAREVQVVRG